MCTILLELAPGGDTPIVLAANRDEFRARDADPPAALGDGVFAGRDRVGGGTWLAVGRGALAAITNVRDTPRDPAAPSRGILPVAAVTGGLPRDLGPWNAFNLLVIDGRGARVLTHLGPGQAPLTTRLGAGRHVIVNEPFGVSSARSVHATALLAAAPPGFGALADHGPPPEAGLCHHGAIYGTVSSTVVALDRAFALRAYHHRAGLPCRTGTEDLTDRARRALARASA